MASAELSVLVRLKDEATREMGRLSKSIQDHANGIRQVGKAATVMGGAIVGAATASVVAYTKLGDQIQKTALRMGFSTEAVSEWRYVADLAGTSIEAVEAATRNMSRTIVDANNGLAESKRAYDALGLSTQDLLALTPEKQFDAVTKALADVASHTEKVAIAQDIFGRGGSQLIPILEGGAAALAKQREEAHKLGIVFDKVSADQAAELNDALTTLKSAFAGAAVEVARMLVPSILTLVGVATAAIKTIKDWIGHHPVLARVIGMATLAVGGLALAIGPLLIMLPGLIAILPALGTAFHLAIGPIGLATGAIAALTAAFIIWRVESSRKAPWEGNVRGFITAINEALEQAKAPQKAMERAMASLGQTAVNAADEARQSWAQFYLETSDAARQFAATGLTVAQVVLKWAEIIGQTREEVISWLADQGVAVEDISKAWQELGIPLEDIAAQYAAVAEAERLVRQAAEEAKTAAEQQAQANSSQARAWMDLLKRNAEAVKDFTTSGLTIDEMLQGWATLSGRTLEQIVADLYSQGVAVEDLAEVWDKLGIPLEAIEDHYKEITRKAGEAEQAQRDLQRAIVSPGVTMMPTVAGMATAYTALTTNLARVGGLAAERVPTLGTFQDIVRQFAATGAATPLIAALESIYSRLAPAGFQHGGIVTRPTLAVLGEKGPEAVVPLGKGAGVTINFNAPVYGMQDFERKVAQAVRDAAMGGGFAGVKVGA